jgi:2',3'-cyclic-nucleotide 2'-phosphodiesterase
MITLLFFGDIVGKAGRKAVKAWLSQHPNTPDRIVVANAENATHGYGLSQNHYTDLLQSGIHLLTGGNHIWDRKDIAKWIDQAEYLVRPANMLATLPGSGAKILTLNGHKLAILNLIGQTFMGGYNSPWEAAKNHLPVLKAACPVVFVDCHAEATAEKVALAHYCASLGASGFVGTHTHVQTADNRLLTGEGDHTMGYLTDAGFNGAYHSVIGMQVEPSVRRMQTGFHEHLEVAETNHVQINAVAYTFDPITGQCHGVERINETMHI